MGNTITLTFAGDTRGLERGVDRAERKMDRFGKKVTGFGAMFSQAGGQATLAIAAIGGALAALPAVAGLALAAVPLMIGGIGIAAAATSEKVKKAFSGLKDHVVKQVKELAKPFEPVLVGIANKAKSTFNTIAPALGNMFKSAAPMVDKLAGALLKLVEGLMGGGGLEKAMSAAKPVIDAIATGLANMGPAISQFFTNLSGGSGGAAEAVGKLFAAINWLIPALGSVLGFMARWQAIVIPLGLAIAAFAIGMKVATLAIAAYNAITIIWAGITKGVAAAQWLLNAALTANPIGIVIVAIGALVAAIIWLWNHNEGFRNFIIRCWTNIKDQIQTAVNAIRSIWDGLVSFFGAASSRIGAIFSGIGNAIRNPLIAAFNAIRGAWNSTVGRIGFSIPSWVPGIGGKSFHMPTFHRGGVVPGRPGTEVMAVLQAGERVSPMGREGGGGAMSINFTGNVDGAFATAFMNLVRTGAIQVQAA